MLDRVPRALVLILLLASSASAATLTLDLGPPIPVPVPGDTQRVTLTLDLDGTEPPTPAIFVELEWQNGEAFEATQNGVVTSFDGAYTWVGASQRFCMPLGLPRCALIDQLASLSPFPVDPGRIVSTIDITFLSFGEPLNVQVAADSLRLFDLTVDDVIIVPEPGTMSLLALGLLGLVRIRRNATR